MCKLLGKECLLTLTNFKSVDATPVHEHSNEEQHFHVVLFIILAVLSGSKF